MIIHVKTEAKSIHLRKQIVLSWHIELTWHLSVVKETTLTGILRNYYYRCRTLIFFQFIFSIIDYNHDSWKCSSTHLTQNCLYRCCTKCFKIWVRSKDSERLEFQLLKILPCNSILQQHPSILPICCMIWCPPVSKPCPITTNIDDYTVKNNYSIWSKKGDHSVKRVKSY